MAIETNELIDVKTLTPFKKFIMTIGNIPTSYLESMTYAELVMWFCNYLQETVIPTVNNNAEAVEELQNLYTQLKEYVDNYFENLDVQEEINQKLDTMAQDGTLYAIIETYTDPIINQFEDSINSTINTMQAQINGVASGSPAGTYSTVSALTTADPDHTKIYLVLEDGKWYYYNNGWNAGGTYQGTSVSDNSIDGTKLFENSAISMNNNELIIKNCQYANDFATANQNNNTTKLMSVSVGDVLTITNAIGNYIAVFDENKHYLGAVGSATLIDNATYTFSNSNYKYCALNLSKDYSHIVTFNGKVIINQYNTPWLNINNNNISKNSINGDKIKDEDIHPSKLMTNSGYSIDKNKIWSTNSETKSTYSNFSCFSDLIEISLTDTLSFVNGRATVVIVYNEDHSVSRSIYSATAIDGSTTFHGTEKYVGLTIETSRLGSTKFYLNGKEIYYNYKKYALDWLDFNDSQIESLGLNTHIKDYKTLFIGDSITEHNYRANKNWVDNIVEWFGITTYTNAGMSGTGILKDFQNHDNWYNSLDDYADDYELILIMGDMNDWSNQIFTSSNIGQFGDDTTSTFYGTMKLYLEKILTKYPTAKIGWITSTPRNQLISGTSDRLHGNTSIFKQANDIIKEMCNNYSIPCLELYTESDLHPWISANNIEYFTAPNEESPDGIHPNDAGQLIMAYKIKGFINNNF